MWFTVYFIIFVVVFFLTYGIYHQLVKINFVYTAIWCFAGMIVSSGYLSLQEVRTEIHIYIIISILVFNFATLQNKDNIYSFEPEWELDNVRFQILLLSNLVSYIFMIPILMRAIKIILTQGWAALRIYAYTGSEMASQSQLRIYAWLVNPVFIATILIVSIMLFYPSRHKKILTILMVIDVIIATVTFGGRMNIFKTVIFIVVTVAMRSIFTHRRLKIRLRYIIMGFVLFALLAYMTSLRSLHGLSFVQNMIIYFVGSIVYFGIISTTSYSPLNSIKSYGLNTFGIITSIPMYLIYKFTGVNLTPEYITDLTSNDYIYISPSIRYNAFTTWLFPFWKDFGVVGIVIGTLFIAIIFLRLKKRVIERLDMSMFSMLVYIEYVILTSTLSYNLMTIQVVVTLVFVRIFTKNAEFIGNIEEETDLEMGDEL